MDYMFLIYADEQSRAQRTDEERAQAMSRHWALMDEATTQGKFRGASPLLPSATAVTLRAFGAKFTVTDGPFAETKETLGGYYLIDCANAVEAQRWAERIVDAVRDATVEVRGLAPIPKRIEHRPKAALTGA